jgi:hypothetical protein
MPQGVSYVHQDHEPANLYIRKHNIHQSTTGPLPCTIEAITRSGTDTPSSRPTGPFSPNVGVQVFSEVRRYGVLRSRASRGPALGASGIPRADERSLPYSPECVEEEFLPYSPECVEEEFCELHL